MRRLGVISLGLCTLAAGLVVAFSRCTTEPVYAGKKLTEWLDSGAEPAVLAVQAIGPAAAPWILRKVRWEHPRWGKWETYHKHWRKLPGFAQAVLPRPRVAAYDEFKAAIVLLEAGPQVLPQLRSGLRENNPAVRLACALTLEGFQASALRSESTLRALRCAAGDEHLEVRQQVEKLIARAESPRSPSAPVP